MTKPPLLVYLDTDWTANGLYDYRRPLFEAASSLGWSRAALIEEGHDQRAKIASLCDEVFTLKEVTAQKVADAVASLKTRYDVRVLTAYVGQTVPGIDVSAIIEDVAGQNGLPSVPASAIKRCNNKCIMRKRLDAAGLANIAAEVVTGDEELISAAQRIGFPLIFKPIFGAGSALVRKCDDLESLLAHYRRFRASYRQITSAVSFGGNAHAFHTDDGKEHAYIPGETALLESYIDGIEVTVECIVHNGEPVPLIVQDKMLVTNEDATVLEHLLITPSSRLDQSQEEQIKAYARDCIAAMGLDRTFVHFEARLTADGPRVIEINPRVGGFYVPKALKDLTGLDPFVASLLLLSGRLSDRAVSKAEETAREHRSEFHTMFVVYPPISGRLVAVDGGERAAQRDGILDFQVSAVPRSIERDAEEEFVAKFWGRAASEEAVQKLYADVLSDLKISVVSEVNSQ